jgi:NTP pyrophosphatase (non-canonical NTP hydrolase)
MQSTKTRSPRAVEFCTGCSHYGHGVNLRELQDVIDATYGERDRDRGVAPTVAWLCEELGELAQAVRKGTPAQVEHEFSDVLAWIATLANQVGVDLTEVVDRYRDGCPKCSALPCAC